MRILNLIALLLISALCWMPRAVAQPAHAAASEFVQRQHLGGNLKTMAFATAQRTQTFAMLVSKMGVSEAGRLVSSELDKHAHQFQEQWDDNLAKAYAENLTRDELVSLASEGRHSRYVGKLSEKQRAVGESMQRMSMPILTRYVTKVMTSAFSTISTR